MCSDMNLWSKWSKCLLLEVRLTVILGRMFGEVEFIKKLLGYIQFLAITWITCLRRDSYAKKSSMIAEKVLLPPCGRGQWSPNKTFRWFDLMEEFSHIGNRLRSEEEMYSIFRDFRKHFGPSYSCCVQLSSLTIIAYFRGGWIRLSEAPFESSFSLRLFPFRDASAIPRNFLHVIDSWRSLFHMVSLLKSAFSHVLQFLVRCPSNNITKGRMSSSFNWTHLHHLTNLQRSLIARRF